MNILQTLPFNYRIQDLLIVKRTCSHQVDRILKKITFKQNRAAHAVRTLVAAVNDTRQQLRLGGCRQDFHAWRYRIVHHLEAIDTIAIGVHAIDKCGLRGLVEQPGFDAIRARLG